MFRLIAQASQPIASSIDPWAAAVWGAIGGGITVMLTVLEMVQNPPPKISVSFLVGNLIAAFIRVVLGGVAAYLLTASNQVSGLFGACGIGMAAPELLRRIKESVAVPRPARRRATARKTPPADSA